MTKKLRWGILGVALINQRLVPAFARTANAELAAIASRSLDKAQKAAKEAGIPKAHGSYEALLDDPIIDVVYNPLPNSLHGEWTKNAAEAQAIVEYCRAKGVKLMDGFMWPHHPRTAQLRRFLDQGGIGEVRRVIGSFTFHMKPLEPSNIRLRPELGGGSLLDIGCYPVFGIRWAFGAEPVRAYATATMKHGVDVDVNGLVWLADGRVGAFDCGFVSPFRQWLEIIGTEGVVTVRDMWLPAWRAAFEIRRDGKPPEEVVVQGEDQIVHMIEDFGRAVLQGEPVKPPPEEAVKTLKVLDALVKSAREGREVAV
jgi:predicted dehydrogenase